MSAAGRSKRLALLDEQANQPPPKREPPVAELRKRADEAAINGTLHWNNLQLQTPREARRRVDPRVLVAQQRRQQLAEKRKVRRQDEVLARPRRRHRGSAHLELMRDGGGARCGLPPRPGRASARGWHRCVGFSREIEATKAQ